MGYKAQESYDLDEERRFRAAHPVRAFIARWGPIPFMLIAIVIGVALSIR